MLTRTLFLAVAGAAVLFVEANIRSDPIIILDCDPLGTLWRMGSNHHCVCRPYFYGEFCHRIRRCVSGRPVTVNCTNPEERYAPHAERRCTSNLKSSIDICDCFYGYTGPLCEYVVKLPLDDEKSPRSYSDHPRQIFPAKHSVPEDGFDTSIEHLDSCDSCGPSNSSWIIFLLLHLLLVICGVVSVSLALICYYRHKTMRLRHRQLANHTIYHNLRPKAESELYLLPPNYEEATTNLCHLHMYEDRGSSSDRRNTADSTLHITHKDNTPDNTLHVTTKDAMVHLHV